MIIKQLKQIVTRINPETGQEVAPKQEIKQYLLLLFYNDSKGEDKTFEILTGRNEAFDFLFQNMDSIDLLQSHVMSQTVPMEKAITAYTFMRLCLEEHMSEQEQDDIEFNAEALNEHITNYYDMEEEQLEEMYTTECSQTLNTLEVNV